MLSFCNRANWCGLQGEGCQALGEEQPWAAKPSAQGSRKGQTSSWGSGEPQVGDRIVREGPQLGLSVGMAGRRASMSVEWMRVEDEGFRVLPASCWDPLSFKVVPGRVELAPLFMQKGAGEVGGTQSSFALFSASPL